MDGLAPSPRRSDRPMVSQDAGHGNDGPRRPPGGFGTLEPSDDGNLSLGRRIGVLVVLAALGGAIVLAAGGVGGDRSVTPLMTASVPPTAGVDRTPRPLPSPPGAAPAIVAPRKSLITTRAIDLRLDVPEPGTTMAGLQVRVYRNATLLESQRVTDTGRVKVRNVPLRRGTNKLSAVIANDGGEGPRSPIVTVTVDDQAPRIGISSPRSGTRLNERRVTIKGKTEAGLTVAARNTTSDAQATAVADAGGAWSMEVGLAAGRNLIAFQARDEAGNKGTDSLVVVRGNGRTAVKLRLSRSRVSLKTLPRTIDATVTVRDADGRPIKGATVTFTLSPPGQLTNTYPATSNGDGVAKSTMRLARSGAIAGDGLVTVLAVAPDGTTATDTVGFKVR